MGPTIDRPLCHQNLFAVVLDGQGRQPIVGIAPATDRQREFIVAEIQSTDAAAVGQVKIIAIGLAKDA